jgi:sideroflexin-5
MFVSEDELNNSVKMLKDYEQTGIIPNNDPETLWRAKKVTGAIIHPDTHEKIPLPLRGSTFVPMNVLIAAGMLTPGASVRNNTHFKRRKRFDSGGGRTESN